MQTLSNLIIFSIFNIGVYIVVQKWNIIKWYDYKQIRSKWMPEFCRFCFFFWISLLVQSYLTQELLKSIAYTIFNAIVIATISTIIRHTIFGSENTDNK